MKNFLRTIIALAFTVALACALAAIWLDDSRWLWTGLLALGCAAIWGARLGSLDVDQTSTEAPAAPLRNDSPVESFMIALTLLPDPHSHKTQRDLKEAVERFKRDIGHHGGEPFFDYDPNKQRDRLVVRSDMLDRPTHTMEWLNFKNARFTK